MQVLISALTAMQLGIPAYKTTMGDINQDAVYVDMDVLIYYHDKSRRIDITDLVQTTMQKHAGQIADSVSRENELMRRIYEFTREDDRRHRRELGEAPRFLDTESKIRREWLP